MTVFSGAAAAIAQVVTFLSSIQDWLSPTRPSGIVHLLGEMEQWDGPGVLAPEKVQRYATRLQQPLLQIGNWSDCLQEEISKQASSSSEEMLHHAVTVAVHMEEATARLQKWLSLATSAAKILLDANCPVGCIVEELPPWQILTVSWANSVISELDGFAARVRVQREEVTRFLREHSHLADSKLCAPVATKFFFRFVEQDVLVKEEGV